MTSPTTPQPYPSWVWVTNEVGIGFWDSPVPMPTKDKIIYRWNESTLEWVAV